jgi:lysophospholipase L1-like esterase
MHRPVLARRAAFADDPLTMIIRKPPVGRPHSQFGALTQRDHGRHDLHPGEASFNSGGRVFAGRRVLVAAAATVLGLASTGAAQTTAAAQQASSPEHYVALGDSYAAGPWIPVQRTDPIGCGRSTHNYPTLVAEALGVADFTDVSCSGAKTDHMTAPQQGPLLGGGTNPPQFDALAPNTDLVTVTIGGNDVGFSDILDTCTRLSSTDPLGNPCERQATAGGTDRYAQRITAAAPKVAGVLEGIRQRSPSATLVLVGYLRFLPPAVGCYPVFPIARGDVPYLDSVLQQQLNAMLAEQASMHDAVFIDSYAHSLGHDACQLPGAKWVEGVVPTSPAYPVHPNARGMQAAATCTLDMLRDLELRDLDEEATPGVTGCPAPNGGKLRPSGEVNLRNRSSKLRPPRQTRPRRPAGAFSTPEPRILGPLYRLVADRCDDLELPGSRMVDVCGRLVLSRCH